ncbi:hypothetical protein HMPREF9065_01737 [Aggregatibacter sp. oral taxon 458 str. W10330]|nr:hypothetical protein HMPREF9065_01737 [Aggregatibacter sp. oral taxon 458 str. W10330]
MTDPIFLSGLFNSSAVKNKHIVIACRIVRNIKNFHQLSENY